MALRPPIPRTSAYSSVICDHRYDEAKSGDGGYRVVGLAYNDVSSPEVPVGGVKQRAAQSGSKIEDRQHCRPHHHRRCHYANARAEEGAYRTGDESASSLASDKADYSFRRNRATHEREAQDITTTTFIEREYLSNF
jgi:hypothetical protein